jgi:hypothetical protein
VPKNELKPEQFPKAVVEALRREGDGLQQMGRAAVNGGFIAGKIREHQRTFTKKMGVLMGKFYVIYGGVVVCFGENHLASHV